MRLKTAIILSLSLGLTAMLPMHVSSQQIVAEDFFGESYVMNLDGHESFADVLEKLKSHLDEGMLDRGSISDGNMPQTHRAVRLQVFPDDYTFFVDYAKKPRQGLRNYAAGISVAEGNDIAYIVKTLSNSSLPKIKTAESSLKKAGDRIDPVHPLQFLAYVFTKEELKVALRNLQGRTWVWKDFLSGVTDTLAEENGKNNILPYLHDFAANIHVDVNLLLLLQQTGKWDKFVITLIEVVPRDGGSGRYDQ